jgi:hypothetical protein
VVPAKFHDSLEEWSDDDGGGGADGEEGEEDGEELDAAEVIERVDLPSPGMSHRTHFLFFLFLCRTECVVSFSSFVAIISLTQFITEEVAGKGHLICAFGSHNESLILGTTNTHAKSAHHSAPSPSLRSFLSSIFSNFENLFFHFIIISPSPDFLHEADPFCSNGVFLQSNVIQSSLEVSSEFANQLYLYLLSLFILFSFDCSCALSLALTFSSLAMVGAIYF